MDAELRKFRKEAKLLLSKHQDFSAKQPECWVAVCGHRVQVDASSLDPLPAQTDVLKIPRGKAVVRYMIQTALR